MTDIHKSSEPELFAGVYWSEVEYRLDGVLTIEQLGGLTKWESDQKAKARVNVLLGN